MAKAARKLGITERMIGYKMKKYGIRRWRMNNDNEPEENKDAGGKETMKSVKVLILLLSLLLTE